MRLYQSACHVVPGCVDASSLFFFLKRSRRESVKKRDIMLMGLRVVIFVRRRWRAGFHTTSRRLLSLWCSTGSSSSSASSSSSSSAQWKNKTICTKWSRGRGGGGGVWRQFKEQHILIYGPLNEVAGTVFFAQTLNIFFFFLYIDVCVYIKKMAYLCTDKPTHLL